MNLTQPILSSWHLSLLHWRALSLSLSVSLSLSLFQLLMSTRKVRERMNRCVLALEEGRARTCTMCHGVYHGNTAPDEEVVTTLGPNWRVPTAGLNRLFVLVLRFCILLPVYSCSQVSPFGSAANGFGTKARENRDSVSRRAVYGVWHCSSRTWMQRAMSFPRRERSRA